MTLRTTIRAVAPVVALFAATAATAGVDVKTRTTTSDAQHENGSGRLRTQGDWLRIDLAAPPSGRGASSLVFDGQARVLRIYRHDDKSYVEIDEKTATELGAKVADARKMMDEQLAKMPPQQRAMMEKMMKGGGLALPNPKAAKKTPPLDAKPTGATDTVDGKSCTVYQLSRGGQTRGDVCVASWDSVGIQPADIAVVKELGEFQRKMTQAMAGAVPGAEQPFELLERIDGFPLRSRRMENGKVVSKTFFEGLSRVDVPADAFAVPAGYAKKSLGARNAR